MTIPARAPYCLKCQSFTTLENGGTECETCGSRNVEMRAVQPAMETPAEPKRNPRPRPVSQERAAALFQQLRESLGS